MIESSTSAEVLGGDIERQTNAKTAHGDCNEVCKV